MRRLLAFQSPFAWEPMLGYLRTRAMPGVEAVDATRYLRSVSLDGARGWIAASLGATADRLELELSASLVPVADAVTLRVRRLFDLDAEPAAIAERLAEDPDLASMIANVPGLRVPGAFDGFEIAVRAILGQQVTVRAAATMAGRWAEAFGEAIATPDLKLSRLAPDAARMARASVADIAALGIIRSRAHAIIQLAEAMVTGRIQLSDTVPVPATIAALQRLPGIGAWTAQYVAMRALRWPDAFPSGDLVLRQAARAGAQALTRRAERWRPWRAYGAHYLWHGAASAR